MKLLSEGTVSVLCGCHSVVHSYYVAKSWKKLYGKWPAWRELFCILLHDIGYVGKNYWSDRSNSGHADLGAYIAGRWFGPHFALLVLGHSSSACEEFDVPVSKLEAADDYSWVICPIWWLRVFKLVEPYLTNPALWKKSVAENFYSHNKVSGTTLANSLRSFE